MTRRGFFGVLAAAAAAVVWPWEIRKPICEDLTGSPKVVPWVRGCVQTSPAMYGHVLGETGWKTSGIGPGCEYETIAEWEADTNV